MTSIEVFAPAGITASAKLFAINSDVVVATSSSMSPIGGTDKGAYLAEFASVAVGAYLIVTYDAGTAVAAAYCYCDAGAAVKRTGSYADTICAMQMEIVRSIKQNKTVTDPVTGIMTVFADDGVTPLFTAQMYEDAAETKTYRGRGAEVRERLS